MQNYVQAQNDVVVILILLLPHGSLLLPSPSPLCTVHRPSSAGRAPFGPLYSCSYRWHGCTSRAAPRFAACCCCPTISSVPFLFYFVFVAVVAYLSTIAVCCFKWFLSVVFVPFLMNQSTHTCCKLSLSLPACVCVCVWSAAAAAACVRSLYGDLPQIGGHKHCKIISSLSPWLERGRGHGQTQPQHRVGQDEQEDKEAKQLHDFCREIYSAKCLSVEERSLLVFVLLLHLQFYLPWKPKTREVVNSDPKETQDSVQSSVEVPSAYTKCLSNIFSKLILRTFLGIREISWRYKKEMWEIGVNIRTNRRDP